MPRAFGLTFDYRCPFARIVHAHVVAGLEAGADWDVTFLPFSLVQSHVEEGQTPIWERPHDDSGLVALQAAIAVRDTQPDVFVAAHHGLYEHRHADAGDLRDREALNSVLKPVGVDTAAMWAEVDSGRPLATVRDEHERYVASHDVWGVPTFVVDDQAVFVRLLDLPTSADDAIATIDRIVDQVSWTTLNEFKHTSIPR